MTQWALCQTVVVLYVPNPCSGNGMEESISSDFDFSVFPNPTDESVTLSFSSTEAVGKLEVQITDMRGVIVVKKQYYSSFTELRTELKIGNLAPGVYTISARGRETFSVKKLIIKN